MNLYYMGGGGLICNCDCINCGLSAFSLGLIPSLRFVDVWGKVLELLNKPLNVVWTYLCL